MNKKADIPVTILVIGVFAICSLAILSFYISTDSIKSSFNSLDYFETINSQIDAYYLYQNLGVPEIEINNLLGIKEGKYLELKKMKRGKELFSIRYELGK